MAIKITKPGQKEFHGFCKWCGCEFTYEISDLRLSATSDKVSCPTCGKDYHHPSMVQDPTIPGGIGYQWPSDSADPCAGCAWRENLLRDGLYIGDTPCTWCNKSKCNNITCSTSPLNGTIQGNDISLKSYLTDYAAGNSVCSCTSKEVPSTYTTASNGCCDDTEGHNSCSGAHKCSGNKNCKGKH
jgi:hypothetical protein